MGREKGGGERGGGEKIYKSKNYYNSLELYIALLSLSNYLSKISNLFIVNITPV